MFEIPNGSLYPGRFHNTTAYAARATPFPLFGQAPSVNMYILSLIDYLYSIEALI
jgi:hypothetical protein